MKLPPKAKEPKHSWFWRTNVKLKIIDLICLALDKFAIYCLKTVRTIKSGVDSISRSKVKTNMHIQYGDWHLTCNFLTAAFKWNCWILHAKLNKLNLALILESDQKLWQFTWIQNDDWRPSWILTSKVFQICVHCGFILLYNFQKILTTTQDCTTKFTTISFFQHASYYDEYANSR